MDKTVTLWTRNFKLAVSGMVISALAGVGLNIALSVVVFEFTQSTLLNSVYLAASFLPNVLLPLIIGPYVDRHNPLKVLVRNEIILALLFLSAGVTLYFVGFEYWSFLFVSMIISSLGVVSQLAGSSMVVQLMDRKFYSQGNAIISTIYPLSNVLVAPLMMWLLRHVGLETILIIYGFACLLDVSIERLIDEPFEYLVTSEKLNVKTYFNDLKNGFQYLKDDRGLYTLFFYFSAVTFVSGAMTLMYPYFNRSAVLTNDHYGLLLSLQSAGYMFGGFFHYFVRIPDHWRYRVALSVYFMFSVLDGLFYFFSFPIMLGVRFLLGFCGMNSANIRTSAIQHRVDTVYRAKINALFAISFTFTEVLGQLLAGYLGDRLEIRFIQLGFNLFYFVAIWLIVVPKKNKLRELYNYSTGKVENQ